MALLQWHCAVMTCLLKCIGSLLTDGGLIITFRMTCKQGHQATIGSEDGCWGSAYLIEHLNLKRTGRHTFHPTFEAEICKESLGFLAVDGIL